MNPLKASNNSTTNKYLDHYAEVESKSIQLSSKTYDYVVVIPACNEFNDFLDNVFSLISENCLIILVVNSPKEHEKWQSANLELIQYLRVKSIAEFPVSENIKHLMFKRLNDVLLVDRNSNGLQINPKQGVGLARKIGADIALRLYDQGVIKNNWIFSTDADVVLPPNYFSCVDSVSEKFSAVVLEFTHVAQDLTLSHLQFLYDFKMRYYLAGIDFAQVNYNYIPLGSTLIVSMECYAQVRGFPKRNAGEDFYLLNKIAKIKPVLSRSNVVVQITSRISDRVPFGTGPALQSIANLDSLNHYKYYHPLCFVYLKHWKVYLDSLWNENHLFINEPQCKMLSQLYVFFNCENVFNKSGKQITSQKRWQQFVHQWFDAFRILKTVHFIDNKLERLNYKELLKDNDFGKVTNSLLNQFIQNNDPF